MGKTRTFQDLALTVGISCSTWAAAPLIVNPNGGGNFCFPKVGPPCYQSAMRTNTQLLLWTLGCFALVCASGSLAMAATTGIGPSFKGPIGLQLYSLRDQFAKDVPGTLDEVKQFGIRYAEVAGTYGLTPDQFKAQLAARGIEPIGAHFPYEEYRDNPDAVALKAKELGPQILRLRLDPAPGRL